MTDTDESPDEQEPDPGSGSGADVEPEPMISDPAKLIRLGTMLQTLMAEVRGADTDEQSRRLLARIHAETMEELGSVLSPDLMAELSEFAGCCDADGVPTAAEIRVAQAQLVGWLQGLLQGLQASMAAQQAAAAQHLRQLGAGRGPGPGPGPSPSPSPSGGSDLPDRSGTYL